MDVKGSHAKLESTALKFKEISSPHLQKVNLRLIISDCMCWCVVCVGAGCVNFFNWVSGYSLFFCRCVGVLVFYVVYSNIFLIAVWLLIQSTPGLPEFALQNKPNYSMLKGEAHPKIKNTHFSSYL